MRVETITAGQGAKTISLLKQLELGGAPVIYVGDDKAALPRGAGGLQPLPLIFLTQMRVI